MATRFRDIVCAGAIALGVSGTAAAEWTKTYVVEWYEPAMYYGASSGVTDPGTDCPKGTNPEPDWIQVLVKAGYSEEEARWLRHPQHPFRVPSNGQNQMAFRGKDRANVYIHPETTPDPGMTPVSGKIGEGFDLDGDRTNGFTGPDGEKGIDNKFYKALGCWLTMRGPPRLSSGALSKNDEMREGAWTVAVVVSGEGDDPMNDDSVRVGFYASDDRLVKDGNGDVARDYTFAIAPHKRYEALFDAKTVDGTIVSTKPAEEIWMRDPSYTREVQVLQARVKLKMKPDGTLSGLLGGYRPWKDVYNGYVKARGSVIEQLTWVQLPSVWYALKRNADYSPSGPGGEKTHISFAMRVDAVPAFVMTPDGKAQVSSVESYKAVAPPDPGRPPTFATLPALEKRVVDGIVRQADGTLPGGPDVVIPPPPGVPTASNAGGAAGSRGR